AITGTKLKVACPCPIEPELGASLAQGTVVLEEKSGSDSSPLPVIIFDWDDTLCPTWWIQKVMEPSLCRVAASTFYAALEAHARHVEAILRAAKKLGHVDIVTAGNKPWFELSAQYLRGVNVSALLKELDIVVYYAVIPNIVPE
ncbi:unnamed protein product, partial [Polarella glacialis]